MEGCKEREEDGCTCGEEEWMEGEEECTEMCRGCSWSASRCIA